MSFFQNWKKFTFFEQKIQHSPELDEFLQQENLNILCIEAGCSYVVFADANGKVFLLNNQLEILILQAFECNCTSVIILSDAHVLCAIGNDTDSYSNQTIKFFSLFKKDSIGLPTAIHSVRLSNVSEITKIDYCHELNLLSYTTKNLEITIIIVDALKPSFILTRIKYKLKVDDPVIDLHFLNNGLFAVTYRDVLFIDYNKKETKKLNTNENQVINYCSVLAKSQTGDLVVGRDDGIYFFNCEEQLSCLAFSDEKVSMCWFDGYLAVMSIESTKKIENKSRYMLNIYDIENKIISFSMFFKYQQNAMISVLSDHGSITLFSPNQHLYKIFELNTKSKLEMLFNKNLYQLAINVAIKKNFNEKLISEIYEQFADYLYNKSNFSQAMEYYVKTIGYLASSYVIQLYLKVQHFTELIIYLEGIHEKKLQTVDHTTLLLNSYIKFNDTVKIAELAKNQNIEFDLNVVIPMLRESNNWKIALELCQRYKDHKNLLKITLEDAHDYQIAIKHIQTLSCEEIDKYLKLFGKDILATNSSGMINLLYVFVNKSFTKSFKIDTSKYIQLFYNYPKLLLLFFEYILQIDSDENLVYKYLEIKLNLLESLENFTEKEGVSNELLNFIISNEDYNTNKVLMLLKNKKFKPGIIYLYKHMKRYLDLVKYLISEVDCDMIIHVCKEFGDEDCWSTALSFFCKSVQYDNYLKESTKYVIENEKLLIFDLMDILSKSKVAKVDIIKEYLIEYIKKESAKSGIIKHDIDSLDEKCKTVKEQIVKMDTDAIVFQASNCAICGDILDLPSTHFYCQHSFHLHCLEGYSEDINVCPMCKEERDNPSKMIIEEDASILADKDTLSIILDAIEKDLII